MNKNIKLPTNKNFGIVFSIVFLIIALFPLINNESLRIWSLIISAVFLFLGLINSKILTPLNNIWFKFGLILGRIVSPVIMGVVFFLVVTPTGLFMRLLKKDLLNLKFNDNDTYWIERKGPKSEMKNQF